MLLKTAGHTGPHIISTRPLSRALPSRYRPRLLGHHPCTLTTTLTTVVMPRPPPYAGRPLLQPSIHLHTRLPVVAPSRPDKKTRKSSTQTVEEGRRGHAETLSDAAQLARAPPPPTHQPCTALLVLFRLRWRDPCRDPGRTRTPRGLLSHRLDAGSGCFATWTSAWFFEYWMPRGDGNGDW